MRLLVILMSAVLLAGCVTAGVKVDEANLTKFEKGRTTYSEVLSRLGAPTTSTLLPDGRRMLMYTWVDARARPENFIPLIGPFVGGADTRATSVIIWISKEGVLDTYSASASQYGVGRGMEAAPSPGRVSGQPRDTPPAAEGR
jgi:hypothetical protein